MRLATTQSVRELLRFDSDLERVNTAIGGYLDTVTVEFEPIVRTHFDRATTTDFFYVRTMLETAPDMFRARLALSRGFLSAAPVVQYAETLALLDNDEGTVLGASALRVGLLKGDILLEGTDLRQMYVKVDYTAGFEPDADDPDLFDQTQVPDWLQAAARTSAIHKLLSLQPELGGGAEAPIRDMAVPKQSIETILAGHVRYFPNALRPMNL